MFIRYSLIISPFIFSTISLLFCLFDVQFLRNISVKSLTVFTDLSISLFAYVNFCLKSILETGEPYILNHILVLKIPKAS